MQTAQLLSRKIGAFEARRRFGKILQEVIATRDGFVVERHGEPVAAVVPITVYEQWKETRNDFFDRIKLASQKANLSDRQADALAQKAVKAVRS